MDNPNLPPFPTDLGFKFKDHTIEELSILWDCSRRTMTDRLAKIRDLLGTRIGQDYSSDQVIIMSLVWVPPEKYYNAIKWMEVNGWKDYFAEKYRLHKWLDPETRNILLAERFGRKQEKKKKGKKGKK
jgi:hypothetical protein